MKYWMGKRVISSRRWDYFEFCCMVWCWWYTMAGHRLLSTEVSSAGLSSRLRFQAHSMCMSSSWFGFFWLRFTQMTGERVVRHREYHDQAELTSIACHGKPSRRYRYLLPSDGFLHRME